MREIGQNYTREDVEYLIGEVQRLSAIQGVSFDELSKVNKINAKLVGHHNPKQRIQYHYKVKEENTQLKKQVVELQSKITKMELENKRLKHDINVFGPVDKENTLNSSTRSTSGIASLTTTPMHSATTKRRVLVAVTPAANPLNRTIL
jgi:hypothetical protein